jgi:stage V sporulation protein SpoVS
VRCGLLRLLYVQVGPLPPPLDPCSSSSSGSSSKGPGSAKVATRHLTSTSNEHAAARNLVEHMPQRGQTVLRVAGPYALETAVLAVALARPMMVAAWGQDLAVLVTWNSNRAYNGAKTGLLLSVFRCAAGSFPPEVQLGPPQTAAPEQQAELWQRARSKAKQQWRKQQQRKQAAKQQQQQGGPEQEAGVVDGS